MREWLWLWSVVVWALACVGAAAAAPMPSSWVQAEPVPVVVDSVPWLGRLVVDTLAPGRPLARDDLEVARAEVIVEVWRATVQWDEAHGGAGWNFAPFDDENEGESRAAVVAFEIPDDFDVPATGGADPCDTGQPFLTSVLDDTYASLGGTPIWLPAGTRVAVGQPGQTRGGRAVEGLLLSFILPGDAPDGSGEGRYVPGGVAAGVATTHPAYAELAGKFCGYAPAADLGGKLSEARIYNAERDGGQASGSGRRSGAAVAYVAPCEGDAGVTRGDFYHFDASAVAMSTAELVGLPYGGEGERIAVSDWAASGEVFSGGAYEAFVTGHDELYRSNELYGIDPGIVCAATRRTLFDDEVAVMERSTVSQSSTGTAVNLDEGPLFVEAPTASGGGGSSGVFRLERLADGATLALIGELEIDGRMRQVAAYEFEVGEPTVYIYDENCGWIGSDVVAREYQHPLAAVGQVLEEVATNPEVIATGVGVGVGIVVSVYIAPAAVAVLGIEGMAAILATEVVLDIVIAGTAEAAIIYAMTGDGDRAIQGLAYAGAGAVGGALVGRALVRLVECRRLLATPGHGGMDEGRLREAIEMLEGAAIAERRAGVVEAHEVGEIAERLVRALDDDAELLGELLADATREGGEDLLEVILRGSDEELTGSLGAWKDLLTRPEWRRKPGYLAKVARYRASGLTVAAEGEELIVRQADGRMIGRLDVDATVLEEANGLRVQGRYSGRHFDPDEAGGAILEADWRTAEISREGLAEVEVHTSRFKYDDGSNDAMIYRLRRIVNEDIPAAEADLRYYTHELEELRRYRAMEYADDYQPADGSVAYDLWNNTHTATLETYRITNERTLFYVE